MRIGGRWRSTHCRFGWQISDRLGGLLLGGLLCFACAPDLNVMTDAPQTKRSNHDLIQRLSGNWEVHTYVSSDCNTLNQFPLPAGRSLWIDTGAALRIRSLNQAYPDIDLFAVDDATLERRTYVDTAGCDYTESWTLQVFDESSSQVTGRFEAAVLLKGPECESIRPHVTLSQRCVTITDWRATRLGAAAD